VEGTHHNDQGIDRRMKAYKEQNVVDSGNCVQDFFIRIIGKQNAKYIQFSNEFSKQSGEVMEFIERNGKPCCLNLITEGDKKFLRQIERKSKVVASNQAQLEESK